MELLDASVGRMVSGGATMVPDALWGIRDSDGSGGGGSDVFAGSGGGAWESGWGEWDKPSPPSEGHLAFDTALAGAAGARTGIAVEAFTAAFLTAAGVTSWGGPIAAVAGLAAGGFAFYQAKKALTH